jgi:Co/Zn/Cd efflux system component
MSTSSSVASFLSMASLPTLHWRALGRDQRARAVIVHTAVSICGVALIMIGAHVTGALALHAFAHLSLFNCMCLVSTLVSAAASVARPTLAYTYGAGRVEIISVFASTIVTLFLCFYVFKEGTEHMLLPEEVSSASIPVFATIGLVVHVFGIFSVRKYAKTHTAVDAYLESMKSALEYSTLALFGPGLLAEVRLAASWGV